MKKNTINRKGEKMREKSAKTILRETGLKGMFAMIIDRCGLLAQAVQAKKDPSEVPPGGFKCNSEPRRLSKRGQTNNKIS